LAVDVEEWRRICEVMACAFHVIVKVVTYPVASDVKHACIDNKWKARSAESWMAVCGLM